MRGILTVALPAVLASFMMASAVADGSEAKGLSAMAIEEVLDKQREALMRRPHAVGVGIGLKNGKPAIVLMLDQASPHALQGLPKEIGGYPLVVEAVREIRAY